MTGQNPQTTQSEPIHLFMEASVSDAPEWIPFLPTPGIYPHPTYGDVDMSTEAIDRYVGNFNAGVYGQKHIPVDLEHDLPLSGAMGYMTELRKNGDGSVDARVDWNDRGKQVLAEQRFKYVSPTLRDTWSDPVSMTPHRNVAVGVALTTRPWFKESSLRPLIAASEAKPAETRQGGSSMAEETKPQNPVQTTIDGPQVDVTEFNELKSANADLLTKFNESETERTKLADEVKVLREHQEEQSFRESLKGVKDIDTHLPILKALPTEMREGYIKTQVDAAATFAEMRKQLTGREIGSDAPGTDASAVTKLNAKANDLRTHDPKLTQAQAFSEACRLDSDLYRQYRAETQA